MISQKKNPVHGTGFFIFLHMPVCEHSPRACPSDSEIDLGAVVAAAKQLLHLAGIDLSRI